MSSAWCKSVPSVYVCGWRCLLYIKFPAYRMGMIILSLSHLFMLQVFWDRAWLCVCAVPDAMGQPPQSFRPSRHRHMNNNNNKRGCDRNSICGASSIWYALSVLQMLTGFSWVWGLNEGQGQLHLMQQVSGKIKNTTHGSPLQIKSYPKRVE